MQMSFVTRPVPALVLLGTILALIWPHHSELFASSGPSSAEGKKRYLVTRDVNGPAERFESLDLTETEAEILRRDPTTLIEPDGPISFEPLHPAPPLKGLGLQATSDEGQKVPLGVQRMGIPSFPLSRINGINEPLDVHVAVLDSGIDGSHPDLEIYTSYSTYGGDGTDADLPHGTSVAGVIAAMDNDIGVVGVAPGVKIWNIQVTGLFPNNSWTDVIVGMEFVRVNSNLISVANISITNPGQTAPFASVRAAVRRLVRSGIVVVAAAGNGSFDLAGPDGIYAPNSGVSDDAVPAAFHESMAVSSMNPATDTFDPRSNFSRVQRPPPPFSLPVPPVEPTYPVSPGNAIDVVAPGFGILSTAYGRGYGIFNGTSLAAPHVAGLVALYIAANGRAHNEQEVYNIRQAIINGGQAQSQWNSTNTLDPDENHEPLAYASLTLLQGLPKITGFVVEGENMIASGSGTRTNGDYYVLMSPSLSLPLREWTPMATNRFNADGSFSFTNVISPSSSRQFIRLEFP